jgi:GT2 family glycosyltransferase
MLRVAAVVVTYNRKQMLLRCLDHLLQQRGASCDILVVDNASTDGTEAALRPYLQRKGVYYCNTGRNCGGTGGFAFGMREAVQRGYDCLWTMDDDALPEPDALSKLLEADAELCGNYGFLCSAVYWKDGSLCRMNRPRVGLRRKLEDYTPGYKPVIMSSFVSFFIRSETVRQQGLPIPEFFIWSDDLEYSRRISRKKKSYAVTESRVLHAMESNAPVGIEADAPDRLWRYRYLYRNEVYVFRREGLRGWAYLWARVGLHSLRVLRSSAPGKREKLRIIWNSFFTGFTFRPVIPFVDDLPTESLFSSAPCP